MLTWADCVASVTRYSFGWQLPEAEIFGHQAAWDRQRVVGCVVDSAAEQARTSPFACLAQTLSVLHRRRHLHPSAGQLRTLHVVYSGTVSIGVAVGRVMPTYHRRRRDATSSWVASASAVCTRLNWVRRSNLTVQVLDSRLFASNLEQVANLMRAQTNSTS